MRLLAREAFQTVLLALVIFMVFQASIQNYRVEGASMESTLHDGQHLLVNKLVYYRLSNEWLARWLPTLGVERDGVLYPFHPPRRGEVVVFNQALPHGNRVNTENETRWSMNCRFKSVFTPYGDKKLGEFFEPVTLRAASKTGMDYKLPEIL